MTTGAVSERGVVAPAAAKLFRSLGDPTRLSVLLTLLNGERRVVDLVRQVGTTQANVSSHLACLKECGLVIDRPAGRQTFYRIAVEDLMGLLRAAEGVLAETGNAVELCPRIEDGSRGRAGSAR
jgi:ArsR family transcriptional regulator